jgi:hypothetical protein
MLDQYWAMEFIKSIERRRNRSIEKKEYGILRHLGF